MMMIQAYRKLSPGRVQAMPPWPEIATIVDMTRPNSVPNWSYLWVFHLVGTLPHPFREKLIRQTSSPSPREQAGRPERGPGPL